MSTGYEIAHALVTATIAISLGVFGGVAACYGLHEALTIPVVVSVSGGVSALGIIDYERRLDKEWRALNAERRLERCDS